MKPLDDLKENLWIKSKRRINRVRPHVDMITSFVTEPILPDIVKHLKAVPKFLKDDRFNELLNETVSNMTFYGRPTTSSLAVGIIFSAKPFMEVISTPVVGYAVDKWVLRILTILSHLMEKLVYNQAKTLYRQM